MASTGMNFNTIDSHKTVTQRSPAKRAAAPSVMNTKQVNFTEDNRRQKNHSQMGQLPSINLVPTEKEPKKTSNARRGSSMLSKFVERDRAMTPKPKEYPEHVPRDY